MKAKEFLKGISKAAKAKSPQIMIIFGITSGIAAIAMAIKGTVKASKMVKEEEARIKEELENAQNDSETEEKHDVNVELSRKRIFKLVWKCYIPMAICAAAFVAFILCGTRVLTKRNAALALAYKGAEATILDLTSATKEIVGDKKFDEIKQTVAKEKFEEEHPDMTEKQLASLNDPEKLVCWDAQSGRFIFGVDYETWRKAVNNFNKQLIKMEYLSLDDFYREFADVAHYPYRDLTSESAKLLGWRHTAADELVEVPDHPIWIDRNKYEFSFTTPPFPNYDAAV